MSGHHEPVGERQGRQPAQDSAALTCPECGVPLELGHDCLADRAPASPFSALEQLQARQIAELEAVVLSLGGCLEEAADWLDVDLAHAPDVPTAQADRELIARWRAALETARSAACVCGEINTRHCPVHGQGETSAATESDASAWESEMRAAFSHALASAMDYMRHMYEDAVRERDALRKRVEYLEQRLEEERKRG